MTSLGSKETLGVPNEGSQSLLSGPRLRFLAPVAFFLTFVFLIATRPHNVPATLRLAGSATLPSTLEIRWDSGRGFNDFERTQITSGPKGSIDFSLTLPPTPIRALRVEPVSATAGLQIVSMRVSWDGGAVELPTTAAPDGSVEVRGLDLATRRFPKLLFFLDAVWALIVASLLLALAGAWTRFKARKPSGEQGLSWTMFVVSTLVYSTWLIGQWPGSMTNDSWITWQQAKTFFFDDWHPYLYVLFTALLQQLWDSPALLCLTQILATAWFGSAVLSRCRRRGVPLGVVLVFFGLFAFSIPIGFMNVILWKDIPFSICVAAASFLVYELSMEREESGAPAEWKGRLIPALLLMVGLCHFRHNGVVFYVGMPILLFPVMSRKSWVQFAGGVAAVFLTFSYLVPWSLGFKKASNSNLAKVKTVVGIMSHPAYYSDTRQQDEQTLSDILKIDWQGQARQTFRTSDDFFTLWDHFNAENRKFRTSPLLDQIPELNHLYRKSVLQNPDVFVGVKAFEFLHSLGISQNQVVPGYTYYNPTQLRGNNLGPPGAFNFGVAIERRVIWPALTRWQDELYDRSTRFAGLLTPQVAVWGLLLPFALLVAAVILEGPFSPPGLFAMPTLATAAFVFFYGAGESWRYFYYAHIVGLLILPVWLSYRITLRRQRAVGPTSS